MLANAYFGGSKTAESGVRCCFTTENGNLGPKTSEFGKSERTLVRQYKALPSVR